MTAVIAHRGASRAERENTIEAFVRAGTMGADAVELDVRRTRDGVLVVHHNPTLSDESVISGCRAVELPPHVPTLDAALNACRGMWVNVEIKNDPSEADFDPDDTIADDTIAALERRGEPSRWVISSFRLETIDRCRALRPDIRTAWLTVGIPDGVVGQLAGLGHRAIHPWVGSVDQALIRECHAAGLDVNIWTCDDPTVMGSLIAWGIDGICTNVPDVALGVRQAAVG